jgi:Xaa-Pro aminopeptidase
MITVDELRAALVDARREIDALRAFARSDDELGRIQAAVERANAATRRAYEEER